MILRRYHKNIIFLFVIIILVYAILVLQELYVKEKTSKATVERKSAPNWTEEHSNCRVKSAIANYRTKVVLRLLTCPEVSPYLEGHFKTVDLSLQPLNVELSLTCGGEIERGGVWKPKDCKARKKVAFMIPLRNRWEQLYTFLNHMLPIFQRQQLHFRVFVVEQVGTARFNKGAIYNIGFNETLQYDDYDCHIFHDVDLLCETDLNFYGCLNSPMHLSVGVDKFNYKLPYYKLVGGVQLFSKEHYILVNGYSNEFWGWGGEDDNLFSRIRQRGLKLVRPSVDVARYKMNKNKHFQSDKWREMNALLIDDNRTKLDVDGLTSINKLNFTIDTKEELLYTLISINLKQTKELPTKRRG